MDNNSTIIKLEKAVLVGVHTGSLDQLNDTTDESMKELALLARTAGAFLVGEVVQNKQHAESATYVGEGKLIEIKQLCDNLEADIVIFDDELSGSQVRNIEEVLGITVIDRSRLILDIFARHATSRAGKCQVELAQLSYMLPRLIGLGKSLSRLGGGIGTRGPGETKLETDRRHVRRRISALKNELKDIKNHRDNIRKKRQKDGIPVVALVGYTNAGKSSLMNALTNAGTLVEDKLFATLDPLVRHLKVSDTLEILLVDTVGFIRKLPHHLVDAFQSTLEETVYANLILNVIDSSSDEIVSQMTVVTKLLNELGATEQPIINVFNKMDNESAVYMATAASVAISAKTGEGINALLEVIEQSLPVAKRKVILHIPYEDARVVSELHKYGEILKHDYEDDKIIVQAVVDACGYSRVKEYIANGS